MPGGRVDGGGALGVDILSRVKGLACIHVLCATCHEQRCELRCLRRSQVLTLNLLMLTCHACNRNTTNDVGKHARMHTHTHTHTHTYACARTPRTHTRPMKLHPQHNIPMTSLDRMLKRALGRHRIQAYPTPPAALSVSSTLTSPVTSRG